MKKGIAVVLVVSLLCACCAFTACESRDETYLLGLCEGISEINTEVENTLTGQYVSDVSGVFGVKSFRFWAHFSRMLIRTSDNEIKVNKANADKMHAVIDAMKSKGVERFICMTSNYLYPVGYDATTYDVIPDPLLEHDEYVSFLEMLGECFRVLAEEFPEIDYFEPTNEPDLANGQNLCKNGYTWGMGADYNADYIFSMEDGTHIVADMCWYVTRAVKGVHAKNKVLLPALCGYADTEYFLDGIYNAIESASLPSGQDTADIRPDDYFEILNWHPYLLDEGANKMDESWINLQKRIYAVAERHGDKGKKVWFTEIGFTDLANDDYMEETAENMTKLFDFVRRDLPFVETVFVFRVSNLTGSAGMNGYEDNFGLFYSFNDGDAAKRGQPKPIALALYKWFHGEDADLSPVYRLAERSV